MPPLADQLRERLRGVCGTQKFTKKSPAKTGWLPTCSSLGLTRRAAGNPQAGLGIKHSQLFELVDQLVAGMGALVVAAEGRPLEAIHMLVHGGW